MKRPVSVLTLLLVGVVLSSCVGSQAPAPVTSYGASAGEGSAGVHAVIEGDTLWSVSNRYNISMSDIAVVNGIHAPFSLSRGQRLKLPPPREYRVHTGDTLYSVSRLFGVNQFDLARNNDLRAPYVLRSGQVLSLPSGAEKEAVFEASVQVARAGQGADVSVSSARAVQPKPEQKPVAQGRGTVTPVKKAPYKTKITARTPSRASSKFSVPVKGKVISNYGPKADGLHNDGINIAAKRGTAVSAAENGVVVYAGNEIKGSGNLVLVRHADRWMTAYAHMDGVNVKRGQVIKRGAKIGTVGSTGAVSTPQLHFEVRRGTEAINPKRYM